MAPVSDDDWSAYSLFFFIHLNFNVHQRLFICIHFSSSAAYFSPYWYSRATAWFSDHCRIRPKSTCTGFSTHSALWAYSPPMRPSTWTKRTPTNRIWQRGTASSASLPSFTRPCSTWPDTTWPCSISSLAVSYRTDSWPRITLRRAPCYSCSRARPCAWA